MELQSWLSVRLPQERCTKVTLRCPGQKGHCLLACKWPVPKGKAVMLQALHHHADSVTTTMALPQFLAPPLLLVIMIQTWLMRMSAHVKAAWPC